MCQEDIESTGFLRTIKTYSPSDTDQKVTLETNSTSKGANYGSSSPKVQFDTYSETIHWRNKLSLLHEVEWTQFNRSYAMTRLAIEHPQLGLSSSGQINITLLFGFSPRLPFPTTYDEFKKVVNAAKRLEYDVNGKELKRQISITVGAAVMPNQASENFTELDIGSFRGEKMCALRRLAAYAAQPDSNVDVLRTGMEDTPYEVTADGCIVRTNNVRLVQIVSSELKRHGVEIETDLGGVRDRLGLTIVNEAYLELLKSRFGVA
ncbi:MAG: hypothetical protein KME54_14750 [Tolypothrix brevis GSE-NOS-MK-07-07A]|nr:hypothetical protein [Tolypothrix brevis GSE-NOS-MK-07-07A]